MSKMTQEQEEHLAQVKRGFLAAVDEKYRKGQAEHGGDLWKKPGVLEMLMDECVDFYVYAFVLKQQRDNPELVDPALRDTPAFYACRNCGGVAKNEFSTLYSCGGCGMWTDSSTKKG